MYRLSPYLKCLEPEGFWILHFFGGDLEYLCIYILGTGPKSKHDIHLYIIYTLYLYPDDNFVPLKKIQLFLIVCINCTKRFPYNMSIHV
jgi:hypothetical protein